MADKFTDNENINENENVENTDAENIGITGQSNAECSGDPQQAEKSTGFTLPEQNGSENIDNSNSNQNGFDAAFPPSDGNNPPVLQWNGQDGKKKKRSKKGFIAAVAVLTALLITTLTCALVFSFKNDEPQETTSDVKAPGVIKETVKISPEQGESLSLQKLYEECSKSCVTVKVAIPGGYSLGSGFVITPDGYIVTNHHVIEGSTAVRIYFYDGKDYEAKIVGSDASSDLAVLKIKADNLPAVTLGSSDDLVVGESVAAIGTPYQMNLAGTLTKGVVSGLNRKVSLSGASGTKTMELIQTDTVINPGNSGGPLFNMKGQVVGINTMKLMDRYEGIGFAIPMSKAVTIINMLIEDGAVIERPDDDYVTVSAALNITGAPVNEVTIREFRLPKDTPEGIIIAAFSGRNTAIYKAGAELYDVITELNGKRIKNMDDLRSALAECKAGDSATMKLYRVLRSADKGEYIEIKFKFDQKM